MIIMNKNDEIPILITANKEKEKSIPLKDIMMNKKNDIEEEKLESHREMTTELSLNNRENKKKKLK